MKTNTKTRSPRTHEGAVAMTEKPIAALHRVLNAHMLWEDTFYLDGKSNADALKEAVGRAARFDPLLTSQAIIDARTSMNIRHAPLLAAVQLADIVKGPLARNTISGVIQRADEMAEVIAMTGENPSHAVLKGIADAFGKFDEYQLGKYQGKGKNVNLVDVVRMAHINPEHAPLANSVIYETLATPDTWEVALSAGADKAETFTRLMTERKLGAMALLRNLRGMLEAGVDRDLMRRAMLQANWKRVLPFRFLSAAKEAPEMATTISDVFKLAVAHGPVLKGKTAVLVDTSGSMSHRLSDKSSVHLYEAGATLAAAIRGDLVDLYEWADRARRVPGWGGLATALSMKTGNVGHGTDLGQAISFAQSRGQSYDRFIVVSDMQLNDARVPSVGGAKLYKLNLSPYQNPGLVIGKGTVEITGFSASVLKFMAEHES